MNSLLPVSLEAFVGVGRRVSARPRWQTIVACTALVLVIGYIDYVAGNQISLSVFYAAPIGTAAWFVGRKPAFLLALLSVTLWIAGDYAIGLYDGEVLIPSINIVSHVTFYGLMVVALRRLSELQSELEERSERRATALAHESAEKARLQREMLNISEREQRRIGQDLHDGLCQHLTGTALAGQILAETMDAAGQDAAGARNIVRLVDEAISLARGIAQGLDPIEMRTDGLMQALQGFAYTTSEVFGVACNFGCPSPVMVSEQDRATHLYRIAQEAVSNAIKHGAATAIDILLDESESEIHMTITDNGTGFDQAKQRSSGMGLRIMRDRAKMMGGKLLVIRSYAEGMSVRCAIPRYPTDDVDG